MPGIVNKGSSKQTPFMLFPDEQLIFKSNPHWILFVFPVASLTAVWLTYLFWVGARVMGFPLLIIYLLLSALAIPATILIFYLDWRFNRLYLTNYRLVKERGFFGQSFMSIFLEQVEDITVSYGIWGRLFDFGNLKIESAGTWGQLVFKGAPDPLGKKFLIEKLL